jgi:hypothetical protein
VDLPEVRQRGRRRLRSLLELPGPSDWRFLVLVLGRHLALQPRKVALDHLANLPGLGLLEQLRHRRVDLHHPQVAVDAAALSLEGVRAENSIGNRTILDVLNAEQELLNSRVQLVTARRNAYVAGFTLLAAMGRAEARDLNLADAGPLYDPELNYQRVRGKIWDWDRDPEPVAEATRTVDLPAANADIAEEDDFADRID